jgi:hypothetical protein
VNIPDVGRASRKSSGWGGKAADRQRRD